MPTEQNWNQKDIKKKNSLDVAFESIETLTKMNCQKLSGR
jgi:hypothetical protein